uniref:26S proteasome non-ATPase regulatory subunit 10 n=1 Tax=Panagrolaimus sp. ES5 TaxID=591445 RepID=A0AC34FJ21_9BILA
MTEKTLSKTEKTVIFNEFVDALRQNLPELAKKFLVEHNWLTNHVDDSGRTAVHWAAVGGCLSILELIASRDPHVLTVSDDAGWNLIMLASSAGRDQVVKYLLSSVDSDVNHKNKNGQTPLHYAASKNHPNIVKLLIENNADLNQTDKLGAAPLHRASAQGHIDVVKILCSNPKIRIDIKDNEGNTPLHLACEDQNDSLAIFLAKSGANVKMQNKEEKTPLDLCKDAELKRKLSQFL